MDIFLRRIFESDVHTNGILEFVADDEKYVFSTLEDAWNAPKVPGETRIPAGSYVIKTRTGSPMSNRYDGKFGPWHRGMLWLQNVPDFTYVYIHIGNKEDDTDGCILIGFTGDYSRGIAGESTNAYRLAYPLILDALERGEPVTIHITDDFLTGA